jgi:hypothetical protein
MKKKKMLIRQHFFQDTITHGTHRPEEYIAGIEIALTKSTSYPLT